MPTPTRSCRHSTGRMPIAAQASISGLRGYHDRNSVPPRFGIPAMTPAPFMCVSLRFLFHQMSQLRHYPGRLLTTMHALNIVEGIAEARDMIVPGRTGEVRRQHHVPELENRIVGRRRLLVKHVEAGAE